MLKTTPKSKQSKLSEEIEQEKINFLLQSTALKKSFRQSITTMKCIKVIFFNKVLVLRVITELSLSLTALLLRSLPFCMVSHSHETQWNSVIL